MAIGDISATPNSTQISVTTSAAVQVAAPDPDRILLKITNTDATNPVYLGGVNVTTTSGDKLAAGASLVITGGPSVSPINAIASGGTVVVSILAIDQ